jgi:gluconate 2-dehydrogenase gamma chain
VTETRRHALKMLGTVGLTCAFPFAGDELYGQHVHVSLAQAPASGPYAPTFFTAAEYTTLSRLTDVIIPPTSTGGAAAAGVPEYIDRVVTLNAEHQQLLRAGLAWLDRQAQTRSSRTFVELSETDQIAILQPLSDAIDRQQREMQQRRFRSDASGRLTYYVAVTDRNTPTPSAVASQPALGATAADLPVRLFRLIKNLTADGYYTSRVGLIEELGYVGNTALAKFPACTIPEQ